MDYSPPGSSVMGFSRQEYWSGRHTLLQGIFPNPGLLHCRQILYLLSPQGRPLGLSLPIFKTGQLDCISKSQSEYAYQSPGILLKCRLLLSRLGVGPETVHF